jgi:hypothetical protein
MKKRYITLDSRPTAKVYWPGHGRLYEAGEFQVEEGERPRACCVGCALNAGGKDWEDLLDGEWVERGQVAQQEYLAWTSYLPDDVFDEVSEVMSELSDGDCVFEENENPAQHLAAHINDNYAPYYPEESVKAIRIIFRWVGEQIGEQWIVRHFPAPEAA